MVKRHSAKSLILGVVLLIIGGALGVGLPIGVGALTSAVQHQVDPGTRSSNSICAQVLRPTRMNAQRPVSGKDRTSGVGDGPQSCGPLNLATLRANEVAVAAEAAAPEPALEGSTFGSTPATGGQTR